jgi:hypothetical protein
MCCSVLRCAVLCRAVEWPAPPTWPTPYPGPRLLGKYHGHGEGYGVGLRFSPPAGAPQVPTAKGGDMMLAAISLEQRTNGGPGLDFSVRNPSVSNRGGSVRAGLNGAADGAGGAAGANGRPRWAVGLLAAGPSRSRDAVPSWAVGRVRPP